MNRLSIATFLFACVASPLARTFPGTIVLLGGLAGTLPTATNDSLGLDQWLLGPEAAVAMVRSRGVLGVLVSHQWDVAGEDESLDIDMRVYAPDMEKLKTWEAPKAGVLQ